MPKRTVQGSTKPPIGLVEFDNCQAEKAYLQVIGKSPDREESGIGFSQPTPFIKYR
jgi:hypothetical protein